MYDEKHQLARNRHLNGYQLAKLHTFEIAARQGSFVLAAEELAITPAPSAIGSTTWKPSWVSSYSSAFTAGSN